MEIKKLTLKDKKAVGMGDIYPTILTIALVAILLAIVMMVLSEFRTAAAFDYATTYNETSTIKVTNANPTITVANSTTCGFHDLSVLYVWNSSDEGTNLSIIEPANYTVNADLGTITYVGTDASYPNGSNWNVTYTNRYDNSLKCESIGDVITNFTDFVPWIGIILLVFAAALVLGILVKSFSGNQGV